MQEQFSNSSTAYAQNIELLPISEIPQTSRKKENRRLYNIRNGTKFPDDILTVRSLFPNSAKILL